MRKNESKQRGRRKRGKIYINIERNIVRDRRENERGRKRSREEG